MSSEKKKFTLIQLTRIGDLLQTIQLATEFKKRHPNISLSLVARKQFAQPLSFLTENLFDEIHLLDFKQTFSKSLNLEKLRENTEQFIKDVSKNEIDVLINISFSKTANYLSSLIPAKHKLGTRIDNSNQVTVTDQWSQLVFSNVMGGVLNPFNLIDIYQNILGLERENSFKTEEIQTISNNLKVIIHPFSSHSKKNWKLNKWVEIFFKLLKSRKDLQLYIVGEEKEYKAGELISNDPLLNSFKDRISNLCGKTTIKELYEILVSSTHFIGHDSMVGHLAKIAKKPTFTIALGTVRPIETAPYGPSSWVLSPKTKCYPCFPDDKCEFYQCHAYISFQGASVLIQSFINNGSINYQEIKKSISSFYLDSINIYESSFSNIGYFQLEPLNKEIQDIKHIFQQFLRISWLFKFSNKEEFQAFPKLSKNNYAILLHSLQGIQQLYELCEFGKKYSKNILLELSSEEPSIEEIKIYSEKIDEVDKLKNLVKKSYPYLSPIIDFYQTAKSNLAGENIVELSESSYIVYDDCSIISSIFYELIEKTLTEYKIGLKENTQHNTKQGA